MIQYIAKENSMTHYISIHNKYEKTNYMYKLNFKYSKHFFAIVKNVCVICARKDHDHAYYLEYFFYDTVNLGHQNYTSKKELYSAIQKLIEENVTAERIDHVEQF